MNGMVLQGNGCTTFNTRHQASPFACSLGWQPTPDTTKQQQPECSSSSFGISLPAIREEEADAEQPDVLPFADSSVLKPVINTFTEHATGTVAPPAVTATAFEQLQVSCPCSCVLLEAASFHIITCMTVCILLCG